MPVGGAWQKGARRAQTSRSRADLAAESGSVILRQKRPQASGPGPQASGTESQLGAMAWQLSCGLKPDAFRAAAGDSTVEIMRAHLARGAGERQQGGREHPARRAHMVRQVPFAEAARPRERRACCVRVERRGALLRGRTRQARACRSNVTIRGWPDRGHRCDVRPPGGHRKVNRFCVVQGFGYAQLVDFVDGLNGLVLRACGSLQQVRWEL